MKKMSMKQPVNRKKLSAILLALLVLLVLVFAAQRVIQRLKPVAIITPPPLAVEVSTLSPEPFMVTRSYSGSVATAQTVEISAQISSRVMIIHHREGEQVQKGDLLISLDDREQLNDVNRLVATNKRLVADYTYWKNQHQRNEKLLREKVIPDSTFEESLRMEDSLKASIEENAALLESARLRLSYTQISAPFSARVKSVLTEEGDLTLQYVRPLLELVSSNAVKAVVSVPQVDLGQLRAGLPVQLQLPLPGLVQQTTIHKIYPTLNPATRNATFEAWFVNEGDQVLNNVYAGMTVDATVVLQQYDAALSIPHEALIENRMGTGVFVLFGNRAVWREVVAGEVAGGKARISDGLTAGEQVIITPDPRIEDGVEVNPVLADTK